jgi:hypothetical protein
MGLIAYRSKGVTVVSNMARQLLTDSTLSGRLDSNWTRVVVLERIARGAGDTNWFFIRSREEVEQVAETLHGGSCVSFYFADQLHVEIDSEEARGRMFDVITHKGELVIGYPSASRPQLEMRIISGPGELGSYLVSQPEGGLVVWGEWPGRDNDADAITLNLVDKDGVLRPHPH